MAVLWQQNSGGANPLRPEGMSVPEQILKGKQKILEGALARAPQGGVIVEIGTMRYGVRGQADGLSTLLWAASGRRAYSIDISPDAIGAAREALEGRRGQVQLVQADGTGWLESFRGPIALLYLDSADHPRFTLEQYLAAEPNLMDMAVVVVDDTHAYAPPNIPPSYGQAMPFGKATMLYPYVMKVGLNPTIHIAYSNEKMLSFIYRRK